MTYPFDPRTRNIRDFEQPKPPLSAKIGWLLAGKVQAITYPVVKGFDISHYNTVEPDGFKKAYAAGYRYAFVKATEGNNWVDPKLNTFVPMLIDAGFLVGMYHFYRDNITGVSQGHFHLDVTANLRNANRGRILPSMVDEETDDGSGVSTRVIRLYDLCDILSIVATPSVYSSPYLWNKLTGGAMLSPRRGMVAHWSNVDIPTVPIGWERESIDYWQIGVAGDARMPWVEKIPGFVGRVDSQLSIGTMQELESRVIGGVNPIPPPPPEDDMDVARIKAELDKIDQAQAVIDLSTEIIRAELVDAPPPPPPPLPPPAPSTVKMRIKVDKTKAWAFQVWNADKGKLIPKENVQGKPIMQEYEDSDGKRLIYTLDTILTFKVGLVDANGDDDFMELFGQFGDHNERLFVLRQALGKLG